MPFLRWGWGALLMAGSPVFAQQAPWGAYPVLPAQPFSEAEQLQLPDRDPADVLRYLGEPSVSRWYQAQNLLSGKMLAQLPGREKLRGRVTELRAVQYGHAVMMREDGERLLLTQSGVDGLTRLFLRNRATNAERLLYVTSEGEQLQGFWPSPDGTQIVVAVTSRGQSSGGASQLKLIAADDAHISDTLASGAIDPTGQDAIVYWLPDASGFLYARERETGQGRQVWLHKLGKPQLLDSAILAPQAQKWIGAGDDVRLISRADSNLLIAQLAHAGNKGNSYYYSQRAEKTGLPASWTKFIGPEDAVVGLALMKDQLALLTDKHSAQREVLLMSQKPLQIKSAKQILAPSGEWLVELKAAGDRLYLHSAVGGESRLYQLGLNGKKTALELPVGGTLMQWQLAEDGHIASVTMEALLQAPQTYRTNEGGHFYPLGSYGEKPQPSFSYQTQTKHVMLTPAGRLDWTFFSEKNSQTSGPELVVLQNSPDGRPLLHFQPEWMAWLERGGRLNFVFPALLNGDAAAAKGIAKATKGKPAALPDQADVLLQLLNVMKAGAAEGERIVLQDTVPGSNLALLAAERQPGLLSAISVRDPITQSPQEFAPASAAKRQPKMMMNATLQAFPFDGVYAGMTFPATLLQAHGDSGVAPVWMAAKMAAALQILALRSQPFLLQTVIDEGSKPEFVSELADIWSFLLWQSGNKDFVPAQDPAINKPQTISKPRN